MNTLLAIEQSTEIASVAIIVGHKVFAHRHWKEGRTRTCLFDMVSEMLDKSGLGLDAIDAYVVGLGPGSYTGLRISLAAAMAFALPTNRQVYGVNSAAPLANSIMKEYSCRSVCIVGDARRGRFWTVCFKKANEPAEQISNAGKWKLVSHEELGSVCPPDSICVTPDWDRIGGVLEHTFPESIVVIKEKRVPSASALGKLAVARMRSGMPSESLSPIYLNPAVADKAVVGYS